MAKQQKFTLDDFKFDKNLDVPDFDFEFKPPKDTRKPIMKVASGVKTGFSAVAFSNDFAKSMVQAALPRGFGSAYDLAEKSASTIKSLYDDTTREIRPFMNDMKRTTARLLPKVDEVMPKKVSEMVKKWTETADTNPSSPNYDPREAEISGMLSGMIKAQALMQQKQNSDDDQKDRLREGLEQVRHRDKLQQMDQMRLGIAQLVDYQANVTSSYHRKSLELQYRHYFVAVDALEESKRSNMELKSMLAAIVHNTALPEQVKLQASDTFKDMAKKRLGSVIGNTIFGRNSEFFNNLTGNLKKTALGRVKSAVGLGQSALGDLGSTLDGMDFAEAMGHKTDPYHAAGVGAGVIGTSILGDWLAGKLKPHLDKMPGVRRTGNKLQYGVQNLPMILGEWARTNKGETGGLQDGLIRFLKANIRGSSRLSTGIQKDTVQGMNEPSFYSRQNSKTLNEIIPGYLARMLRELTIIRTGDQNTEMVHYDYTKNRFDSQSNVRKNAFGSLVKNSEREWTKDNVESLLDEVDKSKSLTPEQRRILGQQLLRNNVRGRLGGVEVLGKSARYDGEAQPHAEQFSKLFRDYFKNDSDATRKHLFAEKYNGLGTDASASREKVQDFINLGMTDFLHETGLVDEDSDHVNLEKFFQYYYGSDYNPAGPGHHTFSGQPMGKKGFRKRRAAARPAPQQYVGQGVTARPQIEVKSNNEDLIKAIQATSVVDPTNKMLEALVRIEERINKGLPTIVVGNVADGSIPDAAIDTGKKGGKGWWWNRSVKDVAKGIGGGIWGGMKGAGKIGNWLVGGGFGAVNAVTRFTTGLIGKQAGRAFDKMRGFKDVYSEETGPRKVLLFGQRLKAGEYFDAKTGKPIHTWKDIQGAVADESGIVMTEEQARTAYVKDGLGKKLIKGLGAVIKPAVKLGNALGGSVFNALPTGWKLVSGAGGMVLKAATNFMNGPQDIYVHDKDHPQRLRKALDAKTMRAGGYKSAVSDHVIKSPKDIDGAVINYKGVTVLEEEEFKLGLFDKNGNPIKTGISRLLGGVGKLAGAGFGAMRWLAGGINQGVGNLLGLGKGFMSGFAGLFGRHGIFFGGGRKLLGTVEEIRDLLKDRLPKPKNIRMGSIEDQHRRRKEKEDEEARRAGKGGQDDGKKTGGVLGLLSKLFGRKKKDEDGDKKGGLMDDIESGVGQYVGEKLTGRFGRVLRRIPGIGRLFGKGAGAAAEGAAESVVGGAAKRGLGSRLLGGLKWGKGLGAGLALGAAGSLANATGHTTLGTGLDYAGTAATGWSALSGAAALAGVEGGALGLLGMGGGALLSGLGAIIASPVLLPALGIAAVAGAGYLGYKFLTRNRLDDFSKIRYAQYGWKPEDSDYVSKVFGFEDALMPGIVYQGGMAQIDPKKVDMKKAVQALGVDLKDREQVNNFAGWYMKRFKPVFITHLTVLNGIKSGTKLRDVDSKLNADEKKKYLAGIQMPSDPYSVMVSPIPGVKLSAGPDDVKAVIDEAKTAIDKKAQTDKDKKPEGVDAKLDAAKTAGAAAGLTAASAAAGQAVDKINQQAAGNQPSPLAKAGTMAGAAISAGAALAPMNNSQLSAMEAIRFKTYGLKEMETDKVSSLRQLEALVQKDVKLSKGQAQWSGSASDVVAKIAPQFGFSGNRSNRAYDWMTWFNKRFLPTYLTYVSAVCSVTGQQDPTSAMRSIKPDDLLNAAKQVVSASSIAYGASTSVWQIPTSPWEDYELNMESASTDGNMASLKQTQKVDKLPEQAAFKSKTTAANDSKNQSQAVSNQPSLLDKLKNGLSNAWDATKKFAGDMWEGAKSAASSAATAVGNFGSSVAKGAGDALKGAGAAVGTAVGAIGKGISGLASKLPMPTGSGSFGAVKDLLTGVAGMTGVPLGLLATMANIESGFRWNVSAGTSSAKGLFQFISSTWKTMLQKYGPKYGIDPSTPATDPRANALMGAEYVKENIDGLKSVKKDITNTDVYLAHFLGLGGARQFLKANPNDIAANVMPAAARANAPIFYDNGRPRTFAEVYAHLNNLVERKGSSFGLGKEPPKSADKAGANQDAKSGAGPAGTKGDGAAAGLMKIADQTPGPAPSTKGPGPMAPTTAAAAVSAQPDSVASMNTQAVSGFQNRNKDLAAQGQYQQESLSKTLGPVNDILQKSYEVQTKMLDALTQLVKMGGLGAAPGQKPNTSTPTGNLSPDAMQRKNPQPMPTPPVSMSKMV